MRNIRPTDIEPLIDILKATNVFTPTEVTCALELLEQVVNDQTQQDYEVLVTEDTGSVAGFVLFGPVPLTDGTYDLYWIATDPTLHGKGVGRKLMAETESRLRSRGARLICLETSSMETYSRTRSFYLKAGYREESRIRDFYRPGDDRITYVKRFAVN